MSKRKPPNNALENDLGLDKFQAAGDPLDAALELDKLEPAQSDNIKVDPYSPAPLPDSILDEPPLDFSHDLDGEGFEICPRSIVEAMLFVGGPPPSILTSDQIASLMRGVRPAEVDDIIRELNATYDKEGCPYHIASVAEGYRMELRADFKSVRDRFYGRHRGTKLSQHAIDVLAIVAYQQPTSREVIEKLRGKPSGAILNQLVRRQLLRIERSNTKDGPTMYHTTPRFLELFGLESLTELPYSQDS